MRVGFLTDETSSLYDQDVAQSYQLGASAVLSKPLLRARLREELVLIGSLAPKPSRVRTTSHRPTADAHHPCQTGGRSIVVSCGPGH